MKGKGLPRSGVEYIRFEATNRGSITIEGNQIVYKESGTGRSDKTWCNSNGHAQSTLRAWRRQYEAEKANVRSKR